ncbi:MAG: cobalamin-dependent protein, partial [Treponema sp.]|nr:cobalamin-dependent protein [Treponema sp.]
MAILLTTINAKWIHPSLALRLLKANLGEPKNGLEPHCEILEFALRQPLAEKLEAIRARHPRILGISVSIWNHRATLELLEALTPGSVSAPIVILGGPEVSYLPEDAEIFRYADYVIRGEGEIAFRELCQTLLDDKRPLAARAPALPSKALPRSTQFIDAAPVDLSRVRQAYHYYTDEDVARKLLYVEASRGCAYRCDFCLSPQQAGLREFPLDAFLGEMETLIDRGQGQGRGAQTVKFLDRSFNLDIKRAVAIMEFFLRHIKARPFCVHFEMVPGRFPPELREL